MRLQYSHVPRSNMHTHTSFCDGKNTPEEMVRAACEAGMVSLGFSGHSHVHFDPDCCMTREQTAAYRAEVLRLREAYADRLDIFLGIEQDLYSDDPPIGYDHIIGSVHYLERKGEIFALDQSREELQRALREYYSGDIYRLMRHYFESVAQLREKTFCNIVGHFDLLAKFNAGGAMFDEANPHYLTMGFEALEALLKHDVLFEINTGAMSRGYRTTPYPSMSFLRFLSQHRARFILNSDAHSADGLMFGYADAVAYAMACGVRRLTVLTKNGAIDHRI